jgi:hypothetical protein
VAATTGKMRRERIEFFIREEAMKGEMRRGMKV